MKQRLNQFLPWRIDQRGVAALEFAVGAPLLFLFMFGLINLGYLGLADYALNQGVIVAARAASVETSNGLAAAPTVVGNATVCPTQPHIQSIFTSAATPGIPQTQMPSIAMSWGGSMSAVCSPASTTVSLAGGWVQVSANYNWVPLIGGFLFGNGFPISATATDQVMLAPAS